MSTDDKQDLLQTVSDLIADGTWEADDFVDVENKTYTFSITVPLMSLGPKGKANDNYNSSATNILSERTDANGNDRR